MEDSKREDSWMEAGKREGSWMRLEIDSHSCNEEFARVTAAVFMSRMNPTMEELEDVKTAVSEAVTNAVIHGYGDEIGMIYIEAQIKGNELSISIRDEGKGIPDVEKAMEPMYTTDTTGERSGMGFSFMEAFMDEVEVESETGHGTCVTMRKRIGKMDDSEVWKEEGEADEVDLEEAEREKQIREQRHDGDIKFPETADFYG